MARLGTGTGLGRGFARAGTLLYPLRGEAAVQAVSSGFVSGGAECICVPVLAPSFIPFPLGDMPGRARNLLASIGPRESGLIVAVAPAGCAGVGG